MMEGNSWNSVNISLDKKSLKSDELEVHLDSDEIRKITKTNEIAARDLLLSFPNIDKEVISFFESNTQVDGSVVISNVELKSTFFKKDGVCFEKNGSTTTRGYDYICSLDTSLTSIQKIKKYQETIHEVIKALGNDRLDNIEKLLLLDYLKNSLITILNSFIYQEKLDLQNVDASGEYEMTRTELMVSVEIVISCSANFILNNDLSNLKIINFDNLLSTTDSAVDKLAKYHMEHKLPSFYVSRPEASHLLTIIGASLLCAEKYKEVDLVVGVPSGGTEFAFTVRDFINKLGNTGSEFALLPISLHSLNQFSDIRSGNNLDQLSLSINKSLSKDVRSVLICDDNTSTGKTLQLLKDSIMSVRPDIKIYCAVAEADIVRSKIDKDNSSRTHIANKNIYADSVNILPVSKSIDPKVDLKEIIEKRKIMSYYKNMEERSHNLVDQIYAKVMSRVNELGTDYSAFTQENAIMSFHGTFLSNFYAEPVELEGKIYPTVEHAYQSAKFSSMDWNTVQLQAKDEINEALKVRGYAAPVSYDKEIFADEKMTAGNVKIIADILRTHGHVDSDWEDRRVKIMIDLLLQKYKEEGLMSKLKETGDKELIEGNTWNDTLWGVCEGKGRNILGIILMEIRKINRGDRQN